jgi:hypothetical protein
MELLPFIWLEWGSYPQHEERKTKEIENAL